MPIKIPTPIYHPMMILGTTIAIAFIPTILNIRVSIVMIHIATPTPPPIAITIELVSMTRPVIVRASIPKKRPIPVIVNTTPLLLIFLIHFFVNKPDMNYINDIVMVIHNAWFAKK